jgi:hypothetical protein
VLDEWQNDRDQYRKQAQRLAMRPRDAEIAMRDDEARLAEWRRRGRVKGVELAAAATRAIETGELAEVCARALAETTVRLARECASAGAARVEVVAYVNELSASFGETIAATVSSVTSQPIPEIRATPSPSPSSGSRASAKPRTQSNRRARRG